MAIVYMAVHKLSGLCYVGATTQLLSERRNSHKTEAGRRLYMVPFHDAIRRYGIDAFEWKEISRHKTIVAALLAEANLVEKLAPEYNAIAGGAGIGMRSMCRPVICLTDGCFFQSASDAARNYDVCKSAVIELCLGKRHRKTVGGLVFKYVDGKPAIPVRPSTRPHNKEIWRAVVGYDGVYEVSNRGLVRSKTRRVRGVDGRSTFKVGRVLSANSGKSLYLMVNLWRDNKYVTRSVHSLVAAAFIGPRPDGMEIRHLERSFLAAVDKLELDLAGAPSELRSGWGGLNTFCKL